MLTMLLLFVSLVGIPLLWTAFVAVYDFGVDRRWWDEYLIFGEDD